MTSPRASRPRAAASPARRAAVAGGILLVVVLAALGIRATLEADREARGRRRQAFVTALRDLARAEAAAAERRVVDLDGDGLPEFLFWQELAGLAGPRTSPDGYARGDRLAPPLLDPAGREVWGKGIVHAGGALGHLVKVYLPAGPGRASEEGLPGAGFRGAVDGDLAERRWCAYAWGRGEPGEAFFVDASGRVLASDNADRHYMAADLVPAWDAAFTRGASGGWDAPVAAGTVGNDGRLWRPVE